MIRGVHTMFYSSEPEAFRAFVRDKLGFPATDVGGGWLIFDLPEADLGCHPAEKGEAPVHLGDRRHLVLLRRHREDRRRAVGPRRGIHRAGRGPGLWPGHLLPRAGRLQGPALPAAILRK